MKALVYLGPNSVTYRDEPDPVPLPGEVLVRVEAVGICGSDMHAYHGHDSRRPAPLILGHEAAGRITGGPRDGERVTINPLVVDPACPYAIEGRWHLSPTRQIISMPPRPGAFAEFVRIPERNVVAIPDSMPIAHAALAEPVAVAWHAVRLGMEKLHQPLAACRVEVLGGPGEQPGVVENAPDALLLLRCEWPPTQVELAGQGHILGPKDLWPVGMVDVLGEVL